MLFNWIYKIVLNAFCKQFQNQKARAKIFRSMLALLFCIALGACAKGNLKFNVLGCPSYNDYQGFNSGDGSAQNPFQVCSATQLDQVRNHLNSKFIQTADIDLDPAANGKSENWFLPIAATNFDPLLDPNTETDAVFNGTYDGGGHTIRNFSYHPTDELSKNYVGFFRVIGIQGTVKQLSLDQASVSGSRYLGVLSGGSLGQIEYVTVSIALITGTEHDGDCPAGAGIVLKCSAVGGLVGFSGAKIEHSKVDHLTLNLGPYDQVGGLVGVIATPNSNVAALSLINSEADSVTLSVEETVEAGRFTQVGGAIGLISLDQFITTIVSGVKVDHPTITFLPAASGVGNVLSSNRVVLGGLVGATSGAVVPLNGGGSGTLFVQIDHSYVLSPQIIAEDNRSVQGFSVGGFEGRISSYSNIYSSYVSGGSINFQSTGTGTGQANISGFLGDANSAAGSGGGGIDTPVNALANLAALGVSLSASTSGSNLIAENGFLGTFQGTINFTYAAEVGFAASGLAVNIEQSAYSNEMTLSNPVHGFDFCDGARCTPSNINDSNYCETNFVPENSKLAKGYTTSSGANPFIGLNSTYLSGINDGGVNAIQNWNFIPGQYPLPITDASISPP